MSTITVQHYSSTSVLIDRRFYSIFELHMVHEVLTVHHIVGEFRLYLLSNTLYHYFYVDVVVGGGEVRGDYIKCLKKDENESLLYLT